MPHHRDKATYRTYGHALGVLLRASKKQGSQPLRIYRCHECDGYHLTKQPLNAPNGPVAPSDNDTSKDDR